MVKVNLDEFDGEESSHSLKLIDEQQLQNALKESAICRDHRIGTNLQEDYSF